jgi:hypothetical protein
MKNLNRLSSLLALVSLFSTPALASRGHYLAHSFNAHAPAKGVVYWGGPVLSSVKVVGVFWGSKVDAETQAKIGDFYKAAVNSTYVDWLNEYATNITAQNGNQGTNQTIGRGSFAGIVTITPKNGGKKLDKTDVQAELEYQIGLGALPKPDANTLYMIYYPPGITLTTGGIASCQAWCGDHEGFDSTAYGPIYYAMMPDVHGACALGCGFAATSFDSLTIISSHELVEAMTDPHCPDIGQNGAPPAAWMDMSQAEVGDLCATSPVAASITYGANTYAVQSEWDNTTTACKGGRFTSP